MTVHRFVFVRHGHVEGARSGDPQLSELGERQARDAGAFLRDHGVLPDLVVATGTLRTESTARLLLEALGQPLTTLLSNQKGFANKVGALEPKLAAWSEAAKCSPATMLFVGHHTSQAYCRDQLSKELSMGRESHGVVLIYERSEASADWILTASTTR